MTQIDDGLILDHVSGAAPRALNVLAACQAQLRPDVATRIAVVENALGVMLQQAGPAPLVRASAEAAIARAGEPSASMEESVIGDEADDFPPALRDLLEAGTTPLNWRRRAGGLSEIRLDALCEAGIEASLLRLAPGGSVPHHAHEGEEYTLVLSGGFSDLHGHYGSGDLCVADEVTSHKPVVDEGEPCLCLSVSFGRLRFTNPLVALADRLLSLRG